MTTPQYQTYIDETWLPYFYCPGCGHGKITDAVNEALVKLQLDPQKIVVVTDIGCVGLSDRYFATNALHGLHGRSLTYATGVKLANPDLHVIVLIGDGGCGIGGTHLINAARRNIGITTIVFNNLNYGMTGGEHSVTTPTGGITATTRYGQLEQPLDIAGTVAINGASFVARTTSFDKTLSDLIVQSIQNDGFSLIDVWELCTAYYVPNNQFSKKALENTLAELNFPTGIIKNQPRPEYSRAYRTSLANETEKSAMPPKTIKSKYSHHLGREFRCVIAGAAGAKIGSAAGMFGLGAAMSDLWVTQRNNYPTTVKSGHSISEVILSPEEILYTEIAKPDLMIALFPEGVAKSKKQLAQLTKEDTLIVNATLPDIETPARKIKLDFKSAGPWGRKKEYWAMMALAKSLEIMAIYPTEAFIEAIKDNPRFAEENLSAIKASENIVSSST
jgi:pyruvate/2-oxoacid:ferredoxin oxidoreductase beta subunit